MRWITSAVIISADLLQCCCSLLQSAAGIHHSSSSAAKAADASNHYTASVMEKCSQWAHIYITDNTNFQTNYVHMTEDMHVFIPSASVARHRTPLMEWNSTISHCEFCPIVPSCLMAGHWLWGKVVFLFIYPRKIAKFIGGTKEINYKEPQESFYNVLTYGFIDNFKTAITFNKRVKTKSLDILSLLILHY